MWITGVAMTAAFVILRAWGVYGDPSPWTTQATPLLTALSFVNCTKQPPSLLFVLMTLGPAIAALAAIDRVNIRGLVGRASRDVRARPAPLLRLAMVRHPRARRAVGTGAGIAGRLDVLGGGSGPPSRGMGVSLPGIYAAWAVMLAVLYLPVGWFAGVKPPSRGGWLTLIHDDRGNRNL